MTSPARSVRALPCALILAAIAAGLHAADPADPVAGREHWAFQPLDISASPAVSDESWARSPIDRFVLAGLDASGLRPAPDTDHRTLARRVFFILTGLPPAPEEIDAFVADASPGALDRLVDSLLSAPQYGERWGRHWLDLARYADSNGLDENFLFREAWRYRNWVIDALNADTSFDRFLLEQIAGDLLPHDSIEQRDRQRIAAGFLVIGPKVLLGNIGENQRMEVADEQLDTLGRAVLGQTLGCARCHDHKFDPIPTADYYALAGILTSTSVMERRHMLGQQRVMERLVGLGAEGDALDAAYEKYWRERPRLKERQERARSALELLKKGDAAGLDALAKKHADAVAKDATDGDATNGDAPMEKRIEAQQALVAELDRLMAKPPPIPPRAMIPADVEKPADEAIRLAGIFNRHGEVVTRGFLRALGDAEVAIPEGQSGRLELARWLTDVEHGAGRLAARVLANRIWRHVMGRGIVRTVDNFGRTGEAPAHPRLLDYLARRLIDSGWSIKALAREIISTRTFAMSSRHDAAAHEIDPENALLWRAHRRRLDPESFRDGMLAAAGALDLRPMDSSVWYLGDQATAVGQNKNRRRTDFPCRSVYLPVIRNDLPELFEAFDFADAHATTGARPETMAATQGLFVLNDDSVMAAAEATARRLLAEERDDDGARVDRLFALVTGERPSAEEREAMVEFIALTTRRLTADEAAEEARDGAAEKQADATTRAWTIACHALFASSRYQILE